MKRDVPGQPSLFDLLEPEHVAVEKINAPPVPREFDPTKLLITDDHGEGCVLENDLGDALGYGRADNIKKLIGRLEKRPSWGSMRHRAAMILVGKGARREVRQRLLTEKQVVLVCMACELPNIDEVQSLIADVFIAWRHGRLIAADAEIETKLLDSTDRAINAAPEVMEALAGLAANDNAMLHRMDKVDHYLDEIKQTVQQLADNGRKDFSKKQKDLYARVLDEYYGGLDPFIGKFKLTDGTGHLLEHPLVEVDHGNGLRNDNRTANGWPLSPEAHKLKTSGKNVHLDFDRFHEKRLELEQREAADADKQPEFEF